MTLQEQAHKSGLVLLDEKWNETDGIPPLLGGWRWKHASVVLHPSDYHHHHHHKKGGPERVLVVVGGIVRGRRNSVLVLKYGTEPHHHHKPQWREGPPMNKRRFSPCAVVCNGGVYVMGGNSGGTSSTCNTFDCIERMDANDLVQSSSDSSNKKKWTLLNCRLSTPRFGCGAVAMHNRYIVVMGGYNDRGGYINRVSQRKDAYLSSVEIIDTSNCHCGAKYECSSIKLCQCDRRSPSHLCGWRQNLPRPL